MKLPFAIAIVASTAFTFGLTEARAGDVAAGEARYGLTCANCHGPAGKGMASFPKLAGQDADFITDRLNTYRAGETVGPNSALMIPMAKGLSDDDIANLAAYLSSQ